jgi:N-acyl-D-amino-acid deacylase
MRLRLLVAALCVLGALASSAGGGTQATPITGDPEPGLAGFDTAMTSMMARYKIPGAALAVVHDGHLVYARGFGYANVATKTLVQPTSRFRLASITKTFTQAAIAKLVEQGKLRVTDKVVGLLKLTPPPKTKADPRANQITISNLLQHRSGWPETIDDVAEAAKELGVTPPASCAQLARYTLGKRLLYAPGTHEAYSNIGYCMLGLVVEKVSGQTYEHFVQRQILAPVGAHSTAMGDVLHALPHEVHYYPDEPKQKSNYPQVKGLVPVPYALALRTDSSAGGLVSTTTDLLRYETNLNGSRGKRILAGPQSRTVFDVLPPTGPGWAFAVEGSLPGTRTILALDDTTAWALLVNLRPSDPSFDNKDVLWSAIDPVVKAVKSWPDIDLFSKYP